MARVAKERYETVGDLIQALKQFPSDYPIEIFTDYDDDEPYFIKDIADYDDACQIELI